MEIHGVNKLFRSYWQAGFECSSQKLRNGKRLDEIAITRHDQFVDQDFARLKDLGIRSVREGIRWHLIEEVPGHYDYSSVFPILEAANRHGIEVQWDLIHFGWPDHLNIFSQDWLDSFAHLARGFGNILQAGTSGRAFVAPVNEISFFSWAGGEVGYLNPFAISRGAELKKHLVKAYLRAAIELRKACPGIRLIAPDPVIHISGDPLNPDDVTSADNYRLSMFEAWDMICGRRNPELGGTPRDLDILGVNYYDKNQWRNYGPILSRFDPEYRPFGLILDEVYDRYRRPLYVSETGTEDDDRPHWLAYIASEVDASIARGTPIQGICLYPILNHPGWDDDRHCRNGLWDYADDEGRRNVYHPLATELVHQQNLKRVEYETTPVPTYVHRTAAGGPPLPVSPSVELRLPAPTTPDGPICQTASSLLLGGTAV